MAIIKTLSLALILLSGLVGFDNLYAAGDLTQRAQALPDLLLGREDSDYNLSQNEYQLETGQAYPLKIIASGKQEYAFQAPGFATSIFPRKIEAGGVEINAITLTELEFEDAGEAEIFFVPSKPGTVRFYAKGLEGKGMVGHFVVK